MLGLGTAIPILGGGGLGAAVLEGVPPAFGIGITGTGGTNSLLDGLQESTSETTPPDLEL